ncbi:uncharacterized protein LOC124814269 [Hydra vulgaris]|uniref:uncharacterized protein LOC124814269 n=1 Tax=Hydra vulgaris TaxID=6087 RepID=UPI001F5E4FE4|nr:uncharacterized protein LOC124814269 [Hydra vulgaris]
MTIFKIEFTSKLFDWCQGFLKNRLQRVVIGNNKSEWEKVVPQELVLEPLLFLVHIKGINKIKSSCKLFADVIKILRAIKNDNDVIELQQDVDLLMEWSNEWLMKFNQQKCKVMIVGNSQHKVLMNNTALVYTSMEKDLGVYISDDLEWKYHVNKAVNKANQKLALVCPNLEYAAPIWNSNRQYDKDKLECVQQSPSRIKSLKGYSSEERLKTWDLLLLENRRRRGHLIQMFKYLKWYDIITFYKKPEMLDNGYKTRCHNSKLRRQYTENIKRHNFFTNRVVNDWNNLKQETTDAVNSCGTPQSDDATGSTAVAESPSLTEEPGPCCLSQSSFPSKKGRKFKQS